MIVLNASYRGTCGRCNLGLWVQPRDGFLPKFIRKVGVEARDFQIHVPDPPYDEVSRNSLRLQFRNPSVTECVHSTMGDPQTLANDPKDADINIPIHQGSVVPRAENQTCFSIAKMFFQHPDGLVVYIHVSGQASVLGVTSR
jgi:hypothetical protein